MIYFYNKFLLLFLPLSLLPLLLHLLFLKQSKTVIFTYTHLINKVINQYLPRRKIVDILVVILRCLIIFCILLYLSRPVVYFNPLKHRAVKILIFLDKSCSMRQKIAGKTKFELCKDFVIQLMKQISMYNVKVKVAVFNDAVEFLTSEFVEINNNLFDKISQLQPSFRSTNISSIMEYILSSYSNSDTIFKVIIVTDFAEHILKDNVCFSTYSYVQAVDIAFCYPEISEKNSCFKNVNILTGQDFAEISYNVETVNNKSLPSPIMLAIEDRVVDVRTAISEKDNKFVYIYDKELKNRLWGMLILPQDSLSEDNLFYFTFDTKIEKPSILCLIHEPLYLKGVDSKKFYLEKLKVLGNKIDIRCVEDEELKHVEILSNVHYNTFIFLGLSDISFIKQLVNKDVTFIIFPDEKVDIENYESILEGLEFVEFQEGRFTSYKLSLGEDENFNSYVQKFDYDKVSVTRRYLLTVTQPQLWKVLLKYTDGTPAIVKQDNLYIFSFSLDKNWTNFVYKPIYVGIFDYIINKNIEKEMKLKDYYYISEYINIPTVTNIKMCYADSYSGENFYEIDNKGVKFFIPGVFDISLSNKEKKKIAVNISYEESNTKLLDKGKIKKFFSSIKNVKLTFFEFKELKTKPVLQWCFGKELTEVLLFVVIVIFILEMIISRLAKRVI